MASLKFHKVKSLPTASTSLTGNIYFNETDKTINICTGTGYSTYNGNNTWRPLGTGATDAAAGNHTHTSVLDVNGSSAITFAYSKAGLSYGDYTHLASWYGSELRAINKSQFAQASHIHKITNN